MTFLKFKLNLLNFAVVATSLSFMSPLALANPPDDGLDNLEIQIKSDAPISGAFASSDLNNDGRLNMSEFTLYAGDMAVSGDADYTAVVATGDYERAFKLLDADASGNLSEAEIVDQDDDLDFDGRASEGQVEPESEY